MEKNEFGKIQFNTKIESEFKNEYIAMMAHEMKNTLSSIVSFSDILLNEKFGKLNDRQKVRMHKIHDSSVHLNKLINDVLDFEKLGLGKLSVDKRSYDLGDICKEAVFDISTISDEKNIIIHANIDQIKIYCDYFRILQVLNNLFNNAVKFSENNSEIILNATSDGKNILFEVIDQGIGIKQSQLENVFKTFQQLDEGKNRLQRGGSGLGLAICKGIIEIHGGKIWIESDYKNGTKVLFTIPNRQVFSNKKTSFGF